MRTLFHVLVSLVLVGAISACNLPSNTSGPQGSSAILTAAALTVQAQMPSATAALAPAPTTVPTFTPIPSPLPTQPPPTSVPPPTSPPPTATSICDKAQFITDVTIPDGTVLSPGEAFTKTWRLKNIGACSWTPSYAVVFFSGSQMGGPSVQALTGNVDPGQTVDISVNLTAPSSAGSYTGYWKLRNAAGETFAQFYVQIEVSGGGGSEPFAVIHVTYDLSTFDEGIYTGCPIVTAHITTNGAGDVKYHWTRSDNASTPVETLHFNSAGTKDVQKEWRLGSGAPPDTYWLGIYIDEPNHQDFGHINVNKCSSP